MSNIPKSERKPTKKDFFDKSIDVRKKVVECIVFDFPDDDFVKQRIRNDIYRAMQDMDELYNQLYGGIK